MIWVSGRVNECHMNRWVGGWVGGLTDLLGEREGSHGQALFIQRKLGAISPVSGLILV